MSEKHCILIVDDEELMREFLSEVFEFHNPLSAANGKEALEIMENQKIDLIISDLKMPEMNGLELLREVKARDENIKVIIITGYASPETAVDCTQAGAINFLKKPFSIGQIRAAVDNALYV